MYPFFFLKIFLTCSFYAYVAFMHLRLIYVFYFVGSNLCHISFTIRNVLLHFMLIDVLLHNEVYLIFK